MFKGSYAVTGPVERHVPVDVKVPGCPPRPAEILRALARLTGREAGPDRRPHEGAAEPGAENPGPQ
jgi:Ni,Fe-hydrogenase III small subunit